MMNPRDVPDYPDIEATIRDLQALYRALVEPGAAAPGQSLQPLRLPRKDDVQTRRSVSGGDPRDLH